MYASGALVLLDGLEAGSGTALTRIDAGPYFAYRGSPLSTQADPPLGDLEGSHSLGRLVEASLVVGNASHPVKILTLDDPGLLQLDVPGLHEIRVSPTLADRTGLQVAQNVTVAASEGTWPLVYRGALTATLRLPDPWIVVNVPGLHERLRAPGASLLFVSEREDALRLEVTGFTVLPAVAGGEFFQTALGEARTLIGSIVYITSATIAILAFSLLSLEIHYRQREMHTLRALGLDGPGFFRLYGLQAAFLVVAGTGLGIALGVVLSHGLVSFAPFFGLPTLIRPQVTMAGLLLPLLASTGAGLLGALVAIPLALRRVGHEA